MGLAVGVPGQLDFATKNTLLHSKRQDKKKLSEFEIKKTLRIAREGASNTRHLQQQKSRHNDRQEYRGKPFKLRETKSKPLKT